YEMISSAAALASEVGSSVAAVAWPGAPADAAERLAAYGAQKVVLFEGDADGYVPDAQVEAALAAQQALEADVLIFPATVHGQELAARVAARLKAPVGSEILELGQENGQIQVVRALYGGKVRATVRYEASPVVLTVRPNTFAAEKRDGGTAEVTKLPWPQVEEKTRVVEMRKSEATRPELTEADVVVSGGRGVGSADGFKVLEELADVLGAAIGASRAAVDAGWRPQTDQVGQTGKVVTPKLYIACGISGSIQHWAGMSGSKCVVGINKDPQAPIFSRADYGIVGDLFEVVPELTKQLKEVKGQS
ncbi:MAG TPA: electron transfer flavoprotein subunit alpha/FixB family protein, partial [Bacteroidetes bacterium]|nr:electron transfer flavoprotein subunit alpha/FixB family protein [Bacteroidota bacterium]